MLSHAYLLLALISTVYAETPVVPCTSAPNANLPLPLSTNVHGCEELPCVLVKGTDAVMDFRFRTKQFSKTLSTGVTAFLGTVPIIYPLPDELGNACLSIQNGYCPVVTNEVLQYQLLFPIAMEFPTIQVWLEFSIIDDVEPITCFRMQARVANS